MKLYKYVKISILKKILSTNKIRFTQPCELNDPFELKPIYSDNIVETQLIGNLSKENIIHVFNIIFNVNYLGLSLSENKYSTLMWSHYAENSTGAMIEFDTECKFFNNEILKNNFLFKIPYSCNRTKFFDNDFIEKVVQYKYDIKDIDNILNVLFTKHSCWSYEGEWRLLRSASALVDINNNILPYDSDPLIPVRLSKIDVVGNFEIQFHDLLFGELIDNPITAIYFGLNTKIEDKQNILDILSEKRMNIELFDSRISDEEYGINYYISNTY